MYTQVHAQLLHKMHIEIVNIEIVYDKLNSSKCNNWRLMLSVLKYGLRKLWHCAFAFRIQFLILYSPSECFSFLMAVHVHAQAVNKPNFSRNKVLITVLTKQNTCCVRFQQCWDTRSDKLHFFHGQLVLSFQLFKFSWARRILASFSSQIICHCWLRLSSNTEFVWHKVTTSHSH